MKKAIVGKIYERFLIDNTCTAESVETRMSEFGIKLYDCKIYLFNLGDVHCFSDHCHKLLFLLSVPGLGLAQAMPFSIIRGESSRLLGSEYQGMFTLGLFTIFSVKL